MKKSNAAIQEEERIQLAPLATPTDLKPAATRDISAAMNAILADVFALYMKTKNFHWHMSGPHFRDYHLLLDEHADQLFAMTDAIAERVRKLGGTTLRSTTVTPSNHAARGGVEIYDLQPSKRVASMLRFRRAPR